MHSWGDKHVDWQGIDDAAYFIGHSLKTYARLSVSQWKEKFGTVRVYCYFGWYTLHYAVWPGRIYRPKWWPMGFDIWLSQTWAWKWLNYWVIGFHQWAYVLAYRVAVARWPHLYKEIVSAADYGELFEGKIPGYKHSDFWVTPKPLTKPKAKKPRC